VSDHDYRQSGHLPKLRSAEEGHADPFDLPRQRRGKTPQMHGRYPDYDVFEQAGHWDEVTRRLVEHRAAEVPPVRFFTATEASALRPFCDLVTAQDAEPRIPVFEMVDAKLYEGKLDGYRHADMPDDTETWRLVARGLDEAARRRGAQSFATASGDEQMEICEDFSTGELEGGVWDDLPCSKAWSVVMRGVLSEFYSHPWAWNEIGYGGPAYPRGYMRLAAGEREPFEAEEVGGEDPVRSTGPQGPR
jgi:gluconate 2-dehydrogenase subunit 3-like protein